MLKPILHCLGIAPWGALRPQNLEEKLIWYTITSTYLIYLCGSMTVWIPAVMWFLGIRLLIKAWRQTEATPPEKRVDPIPWLAWAWVIAVLVVEFGLIMSHLDWQLGQFKIFSTTLNWTRNWALLGLMPLIACYRIRPQIIYRAICVVCIQSLPVMLYCYVMYLLKINPIVYTVPLYKVFGGDPIGYMVDPFMIDWTQNAQLRLNLFTPYANSLGIAGAIYFFLAGRESNRTLRFISMVSAALMVTGSASRTTTFCLVLVPVLAFIMTNINRHSVQITAGIASFIGGISSTYLLELKEQIWSDTFESYRAGSKEIRDRVVKMGLQLWTDSPIWGRGIVESKGPKYTEFIPIGTHNQWVGLLYINGLVGFLAYLIPFTWTGIDLLIKAQNNLTARVAFSIFLTFLICSFGLDIYAAANLYWAGWLVVGIVMKEKLDFKKVEQQELKLVEI